MTFDWDESKNQANIAKHGISFSQAQAIFDGPMVSSVDRRHAYGETRLITVGRLAEDVVIVVVHTVRNDVIRIISARPANRKERRSYGETLR